MTRLKARTLLYQSKILELSLYRLIRWGIKSNRTQYVRGYLFFGLHSVAGIPEPANQQKTG